MSELIKIALAQTTAIPDREANRQKAESMIAEAGSAGASLIAFPEMAFDPFFPQYPTEAKYFDWAEQIPGPTTERFGEIARKHGIAILINLLQTIERGQYFDATAVLGADGELAGYTQMMHICETPGFHEKYYYWPGTTDFPVFNIGNALVAPCICYDRHYPEVMRIFALRGADLILVETATSRDEAGQILEAEMQAAALANGVFVALVNRAGMDGKLDFAGRSFVVNPSGEIITQSKSNNDDLLTVELDLDEISRARHAWPFLRDRRPEIYEGLFDDLESGAQ